MDQIMYILSEYIFRSDFTSGKSSFTTEWNTNYITILFGAVFKYNTGRKRVMPCYILNIVLMIQRAYQPVITDIALLTILINNSHTDACP